MLYGEVAHQRRLWYERHPEAKRRLAHPVVSVGNLSVGGSGKTPLVRHIVRLLIQHGERPAVLSRGYRRARADEGIVVVRNAEQVLADLDRSGDEPLMLAETLPGAAVLVARDRFLAGRLAEARLGCTIHVLDDGFQHLALERDVDLLLMSGEEIEKMQVVPAGRLRERASEAARADAIVLAHATADPSLIARRLGVMTAFRLTQGSGPLCWCGNDAQSIDLAPGSRVLAVAGIARPERFVRDLETRGFVLAATLTFRDHHRFSSADTREIARQAQAHAVDAILTTEKDAVRLQPFATGSVPIAYVPLVVDVEPAASFDAWLMDQLAKARRDLARFGPWPAPLPV